ncbi:MAG: LamG domain-containing protein [archaeon]|jgi:hypothetical protein
MNPLSSNKAISNANKELNQKGQTAIELLLILSVCVVALAIIYSLYYQQVDLSNSSKELTTSKNTIQRLINTANTLYLSGAGSKSRVWVDLPDSLIMSGANIIGREVSLRLSNGTDIFGSSDVNFLGDWKKRDGNYITGGYYANLVFNGTVVEIFYDDFEVSNESIYISAKQGSTTQKSFTVRNNSSYPAVFWLSSNFSHSPFASILIETSDSYFSLASGESKIIDFNVVLALAASGNFAGNIEIIGQINDGLVDTNITKFVSVSVESFLEIKELMAYPNSTSFSSFSGILNTKNFSICNTSSNTISDITWSKDGNADANASGWFSLPTITNIGASQCTSFDLNILVPVGTASMLYDANITAHYNSLASSTSAYIYVTVNNPLIPSSYFLSVTQNTFPNNYSNSNFVSQRTDDNSWGATGEIDWNTQLVNAISSQARALGSDNNVAGLWDANLIAVYHLDGNLVDSKNSNDLTNTGSTPTTSGMFGSLGYSFNGSSQKLSKTSGVSWDITGTPTKSYSFGGWFKPSVLSGISGMSLSATVSVIRLACSSSSGVWIIQNVAGYSNASGGVCVIGKWQHIFGTYDKDTNRLTLYQNGVRVATAIADYNGNNTGATADGINIGNSQNYFAGAIDEVLAFDKTLSESQVQAIYDSQRAKFDSNLVAYVKFNDFNGTSTIEAARGLTVGSYNSTGFTSGMWDSNAVTLDGTNDHAIIFTGQDNNFKYKGGDMSISVWTVPFADTDGGYLVSKPWNAGGVYNYWVKVADRNINVVLYGSNGTSITTPYVLNNFQWNQVVIVLTSDRNIYTYVNGALVNRFPHSITNWTTIPGAGDINTNLAIGSIYPYGTWSGSTTLAYKGIIDEVKMYTKALTQAEIIADYNSWLVNKFVDSNIIDSNSTADWNSIRVNKTAGYNFGKEIEDWNILKSMGINELGNNVDSNYLYNDVNLIGLWHFNDKNSSGWVLNSKTNLRDGNLFGKADVNGVGLWDTNAGFFDGNGDYFEAVNRQDYNAGNNFSISAWIYPKANGAANGGDIITKFYSASVPYVSYGLEFLSTNVLAFGSGATDNSYTNTTTTPVLTLNNWYNVVATYDGSLKKIYLNGVLVDSDSYTKTIIYNTGNVNIGCWTGNLSGNCFNGYIEEPSIWNRVLSASEISDLYTYQKPMFQNGLIGLWHLNGNLNDSSGNSNNGTLNGGSITNGLWGTNAYLFNTTNDYFTVANSTKLNPKRFAISAWIYPYQRDKLMQIYSHRDSANTGSAFLLISSNNTIMLDTYNTSQSRLNPASTFLDSIDVNKWIHVVAVSDGANKSIYKNGVLFNSAAWAFDTNTASSNVYIGSDSLNPNTYNFVGKIEEVGLWERGLSAAEVKDLYRKGVSKLDLNVYSCSDASCVTKTGSQYISDVNNGLWTSLSSSVTNSRYLGVDAFFKPSTSFADQNANIFWTGAFLKDLNVFFYK